MLNVVENANECAHLNSVSVWPTGVNLNSIASDCDLNLFVCCGIYLMI